MEIKNYLNNSIKEHQNEIEGCLATMTTQQKLVKEIKTSNENPHTALVESSKLAVLKDKIMFHKTAMLVLQDVLEKLNEQKN